MGCNASKEPPKDGGSPKPLKVDKNAPTAPVRRRGSAAAQRVEGDPAAINLNTLPKVFKDDETRKRIEACIADNILMKELSADHKKAVVDSKPIPQLV